MFPDWIDDFGFEPVGLPEGYHGRWSLLSVDDVKFLISVGIDPLS